MNTNATVKIYGLDKVYEGKACKTSIGPPTHCLTATENESGEVEFHIVPIATATTEAKPEAAFPA